jgi:cytochrome c
MSNYSNTVFGWILAGGIAAVGLSIASGKFYHSEEPEKPGFVIEAAEAAGAAAGPSLNTLLASADVAAGEKVFAKCTACHTITPGGAAGVGPNLHGIVGKGIGASGFAYSPGLKAVGGTWTFDQMDAWLTNPKKFAEGTKMSFAGLSKGEDRANVIAYMNAQGSNVPLPAADAAPAAPADGAAPAPADAAAPATGAPAAPADGAAAPAAPAPAPAPAPAK